MFFFFHLFTGIILGLLLAELLRDRRWVIPCAIGAVLPDLIDKPLGYLIFPSIGYGRFIFHNLILAVVLLIAGYIVWKYYASPFLFALDIGIISHQVLDSMWENPKMWIYPILGTEIPHAASPGDFLLYLLETDLYNPAEWILLVACIIGAVAYIYRKELGMRAARHTTAMKGLFIASQIALIFVCAIVAACALLKIPLNDLAVTSTDQYLMVIAVLVMLLALIHMRGSRYFSGMESVRSRKNDRKSRYGKTIAQLNLLEMYLTQKGKNPATISVTEAKRFAAQNPDTGKKLAADQYQVVLWTTGILAAFAFAGCGVLIIFGKNIPGFLPMTGALALGILAGSFFMTRQMRRSTK